VNNLEFNNLHSRSKVYYTRTRYNYKKVIWWHTFYSACYTNGVRPSWNFDI